MKRLKPLLIVLPILAVGLYLLIHFLRKPVPTADPAELPIIGPQVAAKIEAPDCPPAPAQENEAAPPSADGTPLSKCCTKVTSSGWLNARVPPTVICKSQPGGTG